LARVDGFAGRRFFEDSQTMIRRLSSGEYRLYSRKKDQKTGKRKKSRHVQKSRCGTEARARGAIFQTARLIG
jgi:hypothetical protein